MAALLVFVSEIFHYFCKFACNTVFFHSVTELGVKRNNAKKVSATDNYLNEEEGESNISVSTLGLIQTAD